MSLDVPGGTFPFGRSASGTDAASIGADPSEQPEHDATVAAFKLDKYEVTVGRFRKYVDSYAGAPAVGAGAHPLVSGTGWKFSWTASMPATAADLRQSLSCSPQGANVWSDAPGLNENLPMNCVTWYEAFAFCYWDGGRLATEAEWEFTAAGGDQNRLYPWGQTITMGQATEAAYGCYFDPAPACDGVLDIAPVGSLAPGAGRWGHRDLGGDMWEWVFDYHDTFPSTPCTNCVNATTGMNRVFKGGGWAGGYFYQRAATRNYAGPGYRSDSVGFRCAR